MTWLRFIRATHRRKLPRRARTSVWPKVLLLSLLVLLGLGGVFLAILGSVRGVTLVVGAVAAAGLVMLPLGLLLVLTLFLSYVAVGGIGYFTKIEVVYWVPYLLGLLLYFRFVIELLASRSQTGGRPVSPSVSILGIFTFVWAVSGLVNGIGFGDWVLAAKHYIMLWGALLVIHYTVRDERLLDWMWKTLLVVTFIQVPVVLYQYIVVGGRIAATGAGSGSDAVSGTLGGSESGGSSAALAFLVVAALVLALAQFRAGLMRTRYLLAVIAAVLAVLALAEVKAAILIFVPLGLAVLYWRTLMRRPVAFIGSAALYALVAVALFAGYQKLHYSRAAASAAQPTTALEAIERALDSETQASMEGFHTYDLGRTALLKFWFTEHQEASLSEILIGHGPAAVRFGRFSAGDIAIRYNQYGLRKTGVSILLWETGVVGLMLVLSMFLVSAAVSNRLSKDDVIPEVHRAYLEAGAVVLVLLAASVFYSRYPIDDPATQLLSMLCMGQVGFWQARVWQTRRVGKVQADGERSRELGVHGGTRRSPGFARLQAPAAALRQPR